MNRPKIIVESNLIFPHEEFNREQSRKRELYREATKFHKEVSKDTQKMAIVKGVKKNVPLRQVNQNEYNNILQGAMQEDKSNERNLKELSQKLEQLYSYYNQSKSQLQLMRDKIEMTPIIKQQNMKLQAQLKRIKGMIQNSFAVKEREK